MEVFILQVFPDGWVRNEINDLAVHCPHKERGCDWEGKIASLEVSLRFYFCIIPDKQCYSFGNPGII